MTRSDSRPMWQPLDQLARHPTLAVFAVLDATLAIAIRALVALHPTLADPERPYYLPPRTPSDRAAPDVALLARRLQDALESYQNALVIETRDAHFDGTPPDDDIPF